MQTRLPEIFEMNSTAEIIVKFMEKIKILKYLNISLFFNEINSKIRNLNSNLFKKFGHNFSSQYYYFNNQFPFPTILALN